MANIVDVTPSVGFGALWTQTGPAAGYGAIDDRRQESIGQREGIVSEGSYLVTQRAAGTNGTVDVAASTGDGIRIQGDSITSQGLYLVPPHSAVINVDIAAGDPTNPRNDLVVLEIKDDAVDASGLNKARVRVIQGTANASAALTDAFGVNGTPALPSSAFPLAVVRQPALGSAITNAMVDDRRYRTVGKLSITASEVVTSTTYALATTPDRIRNLVLPSDGLLYVGFQGRWNGAGATTQRAAIFLNGNQLSIAAATSPAVQEASGVTNTNALATTSGGLFANNTVVPYSGDVTTGQVQTNGNSGYGGAVPIFAAAGVYDVSVRYKSATGSLTIDARKMWAWTVAFPA